MNDRADYPPQVNDIEDARFWAEVFWRWGVQDAKRMNEIEDRLRALEKPWWRGWKP